MGSFSITKKQNIYNINIEYTENDANALSFVISVYIWKYYWNIEMWEYIKPG